MRPPRRVPRGGATVAVATAVANALAYALSLVLSRRLGPVGFGQVAPLLAVVLVASVPGQALQAGTARRVAAGGADAARGLLGPALAVGAGVTAVLLAVSPVLAVLLELPARPLVWTALSLLPTTACFACLGLLQGAERFPRLAAALVVVQVGRLAGGTAGVVAGGSVAAAMAGTAVGLVAAAAVCAALCGALAGLRRGAARVRSAALLGGLSGDSAAMLSVLVLTSMDVVLARALLPAVEAGQYAGGSLVAKAAFFAPSFVAMVLFPALARPDDRAAALRRGGGALAAWAVVATAGAALAAPLLPVVLGEDYRPLTGTAWAFALAGSALAGVLLLVQAGLAVRDRRPSALVWAAAGVEVAVAVAWADSLERLIAVVATGAVVLLVAGVLVERRRAPLAAGPAVTPAGAGTPGAAGAAART